MQINSLSYGVEFIDIEQNTEEWLDLRMGRVGGSAIGKIMANYGKAFGNPAHEVALKIALERITGVRHEQGFSNEHTERGHEQEPIARMLYQDRTFSDVTDGGYYKAGELIGMSPDGNVYKEGLIEIKCVIGTVHFATVKRGAIDPKYKWQVLYNLGVSGRDWIDYVEYSSHFPTGKQLFIERLRAEDNAEEIGMIVSRLNEFKSLVAAKTEMINGIA